MPKLGLSVKLRNLLDGELFRHILTTRLPTIALVFAAQVGLYFLIANLPFLPGEQARYIQSLHNTATALRSESVLGQIGSIFWNNEQIAIQDLSPPLGAFYFLFSTYSTARAIETIAAVSGAAPSYITSEILSMPHSWVELSAYALGVTETGYLARSMLRAGSPFDWEVLERELRYVPPVVLMIVVTLSVAATLEGLEGASGGDYVYLYWIPTAIGIVFVSWTLVRWSRTPHIVQPPVGAPPSVSSAPGVEGLQHNIGLRPQGDEPISRTWLLLPSLELVLAYAVVVYTLYVVFVVFLQSLSSNPSSTELPTLPQQLPVYYIAASIAFVGLLAFLYRLIQLRNQHFEREHAFLEGLMSELKSRAAERGSLDQFLAASAPAQRTLDDIKKNEARRDPLAWAVSTYFIGFLVLFIYYFLTKDYYRHEQREGLFFGQLSFAASIIGIRLNVGIRGKSVPNRSFAVYAILSAITLYSYWLYWNYLLIRDRQQHLDAEHMMEDSAVASLSAPPAEPAPMVPGSVKFCTWCGSPLAPEWKFCMNCGTMRAS